MNTMKSNVFKYYLTLFFFCSTFIMVAQPGIGSDNGGIDDAGTADTTPAATIDDYLLFLTFLGLLFVLFKIKATVNQESRINK